MSWFTGLRRKRHNLTATLAPGGQCVALASGKTILESALAQGIEFPHDCTVGTCGTCRCRLVEGQVEAITPFSYTLSREELAGGYILACQALAKTDVKLEVTVDRAGADTAAVRQGRLVAVDALTHDIKRVRWELDEPMRYRAGQYVNVRWTGGTASRSYSFATPPTAGGSREIVAFIRHVPGGAFTDLLFSGDPGAVQYEFEGPHGDFWLRPGTGPFLCIAGGSGLAPILALLQDAARRRTRRDCVLLFGGRTARDLYAADEIAAIRDSWTAGFAYWPVLSEQAVDGVRQGMVTEHIGAALEKLGPGAQAYLCGPPGMIDAGISALSARGIDLQQIHYDKFTDSSTRNPGSTAR